MASSVTEICNLALSHIKRQYIQSLDDNSREAKECKRIYPLLRDSVLGDFPWGFATKHATLALRTDTPYGNWTYAYAVPSDCLAIRKIWNPYSNEIFIEFDVAASADLTSKLIMTSQADAVLVYTARVTDTNMFDLAFVDALAWRLAADLAVPLTGDTQVQQAAYQMYTMLLGKAQQKSARETYMKVSDDSDFSRSRA